MCHCFNVNSSHVFPPSRFLSRCVRLSVNRFTRNVLREFYFRNVFKRDRRRDNKESIGFLENWTLIRIQKSVSKGLWIYMSTCIQFRLCVLACHCVHGVSNKKPAADIRNRRSSPSTHRRCWCCQLNSNSFRSYVISSRTMRHM